MPRVRSKPLCVRTHTSVSLIKIICSNTATAPRLWPAAPATNADTPAANGQAQAQTLVKSLVRGAGQVAGQIAGRITSLPSPGRHGLGKWPGPGSALPGPASRPPVPVRGPDPSRAQRRRRHAVTDGAAGGWQFLCCLWGSPHRLRNLRNLPDLRNLSDLRNLADLRKSRRSPLSRNLDNLGDRGDPARQVCTFDAATSAFAKLKASVT